MTVDDESENLNISDLRRLFEKGQLDCLSSGRYEGE